LEGDEAATAWLEAMKANGAVEYPGNSQIVEAVANGEVTLGLVNHYYVFRFLDEQGESFKARNAFSASGDAGSLINVAGAAVLATNDAGSSAERFIEFLLSQEAQEYFRDETHEYPLAAGVAPRPELPALADLNTPELALGNLADLEGTLDLMRDAGVIP
ncbi:MAG: extracellular solute-binding protein, partial [Dehalococcoidia bacterium]